MVRGGHDSCSSLYIDKAKSEFEQGWIIEKDNFLNETESEAPFQWTGKYAEPSRMLLTLFKIQLPSIQTHGFSVAYHKHFRW